VQILTLSLVTVVLVEIRDFDLVIGSFTPVSAVLDRNR